MRSATLLTSALAASALALPQGELEKRQGFTVIDFVTVTSTVILRPYATPVWKGPPKFSETPNTRRPTNAPTLPVWTPPRPDAWRTSTPTPSIPTRTTSSTPGLSVYPPTSIRTTPSSSTTKPDSSATTSSSKSTTPSSRSSSVATFITIPTGTTTSPSSYPPTPTSRPPVSSSAVPPVSSGAPLDPGHAPGAGQAYLNPASGAAYRNSILYHHNAARANHGAAPLVWNDTVASTAKITADTCRFEHYLPEGSQQGQNLFTISGDYFNVTAGITESWYKGEFNAMEGYFGASDLPSDIFHEVGHLTQVLWKGTTSVGCYSLDCGTKMVVNGQTGSRLNKYTVCNYYPAGNWGGQYAVNVGRPISSTALGSWIN